MLSSKFVVGYAFLISIRSSRSFVLRSATSYWIRPTFRSSPLLFLAAGVPSSSSVALRMASTTAKTVDDPHKFLEDVLGDEALEWVKERNVECNNKFGDPTKTEDYKRILSILDSKERIPHVAQIGDGYYYNFWQDDEHVQGIWRKTTLESYKTSSPEWETVLDLDALDPPTTDTASTWVWHGSTLLDEGPDTTPDRALIALSPGGSDADVSREFDLKTQKFIDSADGGFVLKEPAKSQISYRSKDEVLIGTDFGGDGSAMTDSGYPRIVKSWRRGTPLEDAKIVFEGEQTDIAVSQWTYHDRNGTVHEFQLRSVTFYTSKFWYRSLTPEKLASTTADEETTLFKEVPIPEDATVSTFGSEAMVSLRSDWKPPGSDKEYKSGSLLTAPMADIMNDDWANVKALFEPTPTKSLEATTYTKDYVVLTVLEDVRTTLVLYKHGDKEGEWDRMPAPENAVSVGESLSLGNPNRDDARDNRLFFERDGYLVPETLELVEDVGRLDVREALKSKPAMFKSDGLCVEQNFCTSEDGTRIPYFVVRREDLVFNGNNPTLVDAYGGFEISMTPGYGAGTGAAWLEAGGVKVVANIRGGGEYGPAWHQAALKAKRHKCYEDMEAVAKDLIARGITSPEKLACIGGSNGGLMVGNMITRPLSSRLFGAAVCQVPLLDMKVYSKLLAGASWMAEYGDPDTEEWEFLRKHSPYHLLRHDNLGVPEEGQDDDGEAKVPDWVCPKVLFTTSTRDDRVHPGHARKMVRALLEEARPMGKAPEVHYWENMEGGHGGAADNKQRAQMWALTYAMLKQTLGLEVTE